jgi:glycosyltransferase involved in cell wall biosynthesis
MRLSSPTQLPPAVRALHVTPVFYPAHGDGGPVVAFYELCRGLAQQGCEVRVLTTDAHGWHRSLDVETAREIEVEPNFQVRYCRRVMRRSIAPMLLRLLPSYIEWADVVHLQSVYNFPTIPTLIACRIYGKPVVWSPDGALQRWQGTRRLAAKGIWDRLCRAVASDKLIIHAASEQEARDARACFPSTEVAVIPHSVPVPRRVWHVERGEAFRLLYMGRLDPIKGIENLVAACKILKDQNRLLWSLTIAGDGETAYAGKLRAMIQSLGLSPDGEQGLPGQVRMVGHVSGDAKERLFEHADMLVVPSYRENFGIVVAEALVRETPVIASTGTPWERIEERGCGLWVDNASESLAKAIERMSNMPLREMGRRGREWARECFPGDRVARDMIACYKAAHNRVSGMSARR